MLVDRRPEERNRMQHLISQQSFDEERALYALKDAEVSGCTFEGPADGESALKECRSVKVKNCRFALRYPLWHAKDFLLLDSRVEETARAPMWYTELGTIRHSYIEGVKAVRECDDTLIEDSSIRSPEFGWKCRKLKVRRSAIESEYLFFGSSDVEVSELRMKGKYSFQYVDGLTIENSMLDTKDAFWHSKNITVTDTTLKGEYLAWFSDGLTLINCHIEGTQPFCYCKNLRLINCTMSGTDLAFEYSDVEADVKGEILSVKNPRSGSIVADSIGEIVSEDSIMESTCLIRCRSDETK